MNYEPETGGWDDILLGGVKKPFFQEKGSIAQLNSELDKFTINLRFNLIYVLVNTDLKELIMLFYYGDLSTLTDKFVCEGLMKLEKLQKLRMLTMLKPGFQVSVNC